jgi:hypothetical protein
MIDRVIHIRPGETITIRCGEDEIVENENVEEQQGGKKSRKTRKNRRTSDGGGKKRKPSGFMNFSKKMREEIGAEDPKMRSDVVAMAREIGKRWRALSDSEKAKY